MTVWREPRMEELLQDDSTTTRWRHPGLAPAQIRKSLILFFYVKVIKYTIISCIFGFLHVGSLTSASTRQISLPLSPCFLHQLLLLLPSFLLPPLPPSILWISPRLNNKAAVAPESGGQERPSMS